MEKQDNQNNLPQGTKRVKSRKKIMTWGIIIISILAIIALAIIFELR